MFIRPRVDLVVVVLAVVFGAVSLIGGMPASHPSVQIVTTPAAHRESPQTSLNIALTGTATASTEASGAPASNASQG